jgi:cytochrome c-type biogenesis protein CcmE
MNAKLRRRLVVVTGVIIIVVVVVIAVVSASTNAQKLNVAQAANGEYAGKKVQVTGLVVDNSYSYSGNELRFAIYDEGASEAVQLRVVYDKGVSATFGNQVKAICTGVIDGDGVLRCSELVTQCPSKYENATDALNVEQLLGYGDAIVGKPVKVVGMVKDGSLKPAGQGDRFVISDAASGEELAVRFDGALANEISEGTVVVLTGALDQSKRFEATDVALKA